MNKEFFDKVKSTMNTAADSLSTVAQNFVEKNRTKAKLNRLRMVMKSESELMNRAYIELGKEFYEALKKDGAVAGEKQKNLVEVVDKSKAKIARARECYRSVLEQQNEFIYASPSTVEKHEVKQEEVVDITVACSNEGDYSSSPFENCEPSVREKVEEVKEAVEEKAEEAVEKAEALKNKAAAVKDAVVESVGESKEHIHKAVKEALDEEYPDQELF